jgi:NADPH-dependent glutamate synthase beta subunit-like oxidoreductase
MSADEQHPNGDARGGRGAFTEPPEPDVYGPERVAPRPVPGELDPVDDVPDVNFVPAPCQVACPIGTDAPSYLAYIWEGKTEEAFEAITATNPFSSVCGRVCDAPCEPACRRADSDGPIAIRNLKRFVMDELGATYKPAAVPVTKEQTVGIVGGGPAGLTAAQDLAEAGYAVDVYEMTSMLGGYMTWGIPEFRCPREIFEEDINRILARCPGITVHLNTALGADVTLDELKERHDAVLLSIGAWWGKGVGLEKPTIDERVIDGVTFLRRINDGERPAMPSRVVVVGAGDVAMDACRVAKRLPGCEHVQVLYRRGEDEIPARLDELEGALKEDVELIHNIQPVAVTGEHGDFALRCVRTELGEPEEDGRRWPENVPGSEHEYACGLVILATGQRTESEHLEALGMLHEDKVRTDWDSMRTSDPQVFAAGDGAFGPSTIVMAMQHGHRAAYYLKSFLEGIDDPLPYRVPFKTRRVPIAQDPEWEVFHREEQAFHGLGENPVQFPEIESAYDAESARREAARCYRCDAETGSADYNVHAREDIFVMARTQPDDGLKQRATFSKRLRSPMDVQPVERPPSFDDLVFLPANLSRLVIDPYRDACRVNVSLGERVELAAPFVATGLDQAPDEVRIALGRALATVGLGYLGRRPTT